MSEKEFLTLADVATMLRVSKPTVSKAVKTQGLPALRMGERVLRFKRTDVLEWIEVRKKGGARGSSAA